MLLPALLGYGGAKLFGESDKTALNFGIGGFGLSSLAHVAGVLSGIARRPRTPEEQEEYNNSTGSTIANYLIPGVAAHNTGRRLKSALVAVEKANNKSREKSASVLDKLKLSIYRNPTAWMTGAGALTGGGLLTREEFGH